MKLRENFFLFGFCLLFLSSFGVKAQIGNVDRDAKIKPAGQIEELTHPIILRRPLVIFRGLSVTLVSVLTIMLSLASSNWRFC